MSLERATAIVIAAIWLLTGSLYLAVPSWRAVIVGEDRLLEMGTVILLSIALVVSVRGSRSAWQGPLSVVTIVVRAVPFLVAVAILDELSFGMRIFDFDPPVIEGANLDAVHDLVLITALFVSHRVAPVLIVLIGLAAVIVFVGVAVAVMRLGWIEELRGLAVTKFLAAAVVVASIATLIDLDLVAIPFLQLWEELLEVAGAVLIVAGCVSLLDQPLFARNPGRIESTPEAAALGSRDASV